jgi:hypothetical protein
LEAGIEGAIHAMLEKLEESKSMEFEEWEVDNSIWMKEASGGKGTGAPAEATLPRGPRGCCSRRCGPTNPASAGGGHTYYDRVRGL